MSWIVRGGEETASRKLKENEERIVTEAKGKIDSWENVINHVKSIRGWGWTMCYSISPPNAIRSSGEIGWSGGGENHNRNEPNVRLGNLILGFPCSVALSPGAPLLWSDLGTHSVPLPLSCALLASHTEGALYGTTGHVGNHVQDSALLNWSHTRLAFALFSFLLPFLVP